MFKLSNEGTEFVKKELTRYETKESAIIPALYQVQKENGWVSPESVAHLSELMGLHSALIEEVLTFYTMFNRKPVGKYHVQVCCNISCAMAGGRELTDTLVKEFGCKSTGEISPDGRFTFNKVECLGSCGTAPMMQINDKYYENLTVESAMKQLHELSREMK